jgi:hypothetical protein
VRDHSLDGEVDGVIESADRWPIEQAVKIITLKNYFGEDDYFRLIGYQDIIKKRAK